MADDVIYLDCHATTPVDPRVLDAMLPYFSRKFGNAGSVSHAFGWEAKEAVDAGRAAIARAIGASPREIVFTSGATESNNLAIRGLLERSPPGGGRLLSVATEHRAVLDPLDRMARRGFEVTLLPVEPAGAPRAGFLAPGRVAEALRDDTRLVSVMLANNEIGVIQALPEIAAICRERNVPLHCDATQAVGKLPVDVEALGVDLMSFSAHKLYGPKGIGALYVRRRRGLRLAAQIDGGRQEGGLRSGTANVPGIVGFARAVLIAIDEMPAERQRLAVLRQRLFDGLRRRVDDLVVNGPSWDEPEWRLPGNLNVSFPRVDGEALLIRIKRLAVSSGSACTSADPEPSHVLRALGMPEDLARASLRFGLGRFTTESEIDRAAELVAEAVHDLRNMASL